MTAPDAAAASPALAVYEATWESPPLRALCTPFRVRTNIDGLGDFLAEMLAPLIATRAVDAAATISLDDRGAGHPERYALSVDGDVLHEAPESRQLVAMLSWAVNRRAVIGTCGHLILHAGAVEIGGRGVLVVGETGAGKSTLVTGLVRGGAGYLTDEAAAVDTTAGIITPYPKAITLDQGSWPLFPDLRPDVPEVLEPARHVSWHVNPDRVRSGSVAAGCPPALVVLTHYRASAPPAEVSAVAPRDAVLALAGQSFNFTDIGRTAFDTAVWVARHCPTVRIVNSDLDAACAAVHDALEKTP